MEHLEGEHVTGLRLECPVIGVRGIRQGSPAAGGQIFRDILVENNQRGGLRAVVRFGFGCVASHLGNGELDLMGQRQVVAELVSQRGGGREAIEPRWQWCVGDCITVAEPGGVGRGNDSEGAVIRCSKHAVGTGPGQRVVRGAADRGGLHVLVEAEGEGTHHSRGAVQRQGVADNGRRQGVRHAQVQQVFGHDPPSAGGVHPDVVGGVVAGPQRVHKLDRSLGVGSDLRPVLPVKLERGL